MSLSKFPWIWTTSVRKVTKHILSRNKFFDFSSSEIELPNVNVIPPSRDLDWRQNVPDLETCKWNIEYHLIWNKITNLYFSQTWNLKRTRISNYYSWKDYFHFFTLILKSDLDFGWLQSLICMIGWLAESDCSSSNIWWLWRWRWQALFGSDISFNVVSHQQKQRNEERKLKTFANFIFFHDISSKWFNN